MSKEIGPLHAARDEDYLLALQKLAFPGGEAALTRRETRTYLENLREVYAWDRLAEFLCMPGYQRAERNTTGPFLGYDLGSSYPALAWSFWKAHHLHSQALASRAVGESVDLIQTNQLPVAYNLSKGARRMLLQAVAPKDARSRQVIEEIVAAIYYRPPIQSDQDSRKQRQERVFHYLLRQFESHDVPKRMFRVHKRVTLQDMLTDATGENMDEFLERLALYLAHKLASSLRTHNIFSVDLKDFDELKAEAQKTGFPKTYKGSSIFTDDAEIAAHHIKANILGLSIEENSVSHVVSVESWPCHFKDVPFDQQMAFLRRLARGMQSGGTGTIFPWDIIGVSSQESRYMLDEFQNVFQEHGVVVDPQPVPIADLKRHMGHHEYALARVSPAFVDLDSDKLVVLHFEKPRGSSAA